MTINEFNGKSFINEGILITPAIHNLRRLENGKNFNCNWLNSPNTKIEWTSYFSFKIRMDYWMKKLLK